MLVLAGWIHCNQSRDCKWRQATMQRRQLKAECNFTWAIGFRSNCIPSLNPPPSNVRCYLCFVFPNRCCGWSTALPSVRNSGRCHLRSASSARLRRRKALTCHESISWLDSQEAPRQSTARDVCAYPCTCSRDTSLGQDKGVYPVKMNLLVFVFNFSLKSTGPPNLF